jgi:subtilase-type serine protease
MDRMKAGMPVFDSLLMTREVAVARTALAQLAGDIHPSALGVLTQDASLTRDAVLRRLRQADVAWGRSSSGLGADRFATGIWGQHINDWDRMPGHAGAASLRSSYQGMLFGADTRVGKNTRAGIAVGWGHANFDARGRLANAKIENYTLTVYGGTTWDRVSWRYGATQGWHHINSRRHVNLMGTQRVQTRYNAKTIQAFTELGLPQRWGAIKIEPYIGLAFTTVQASRFEEPGPAGLRARRAAHDTWFSTLGTRVGTEWDLGRHGQITVEGMAGWRHALGGHAPTTTMQLAGTPRFTVGGAAPAGDALLLDASVQWQAHAQASIGLGYFV